MITLGILGIVAALTMPSLISNIQDKVFETQRKAAMSKLSQALTLMNADGKLEASYSSDEFVENLKSYLKITKVCEQSDLTSCFPDKVAMATVDKAQANQVEQGVLDILDKTIRDTDMADELGFLESTNTFVNHLIPSAQAAIMSNPASELETGNLTLYPLYSKKNAVSDLKGIVTADGTGMLIGYARGCSIAPNDGSSLPQANQSNQNVLDILGFNVIDSILGISPAYASSSVDTTVMPVSKDERACVVAMVDVNTDKKPNKIDKDVFYYQATSSAIFLIE